MDFYKKFIILLSPYSLKYGDLIVNNCLHNYDENKNSLNIIFADSELTNILYNIIIYGKLNSKTDKLYSTHSRLNSLDEDTKHFMSLEIENYQRNTFYLDKVLLISLSISLLTFILHLKS